MTDFARNAPKLNDDPQAWQRAKKCLIPVLNQVLCQLLPEEDENRSKIIMPDVLKNKGVQVSQRFLVIAVGPTCVQIKEGNVVVGVLGVPANNAPGVIHRGQRLLVLVETQCVSVECDEDGKAAVMS